MTEDASLSNGGRSRAADADTSTAAERAYEFIRARLFDHTYVGGMMLSEKEIADQLGMSRTPVHEALLKCEFEGHVRLYSRRGALVIPVSLSEIDSILEYRKLIETFAAQKATESGRIGTALQEAVERQRRFLSETRDDEFALADREFHELLVHSAGNPHLVRAYRIAHDFPLRLPIIRLSSEGDRMRQIIEEHSAIADAIAARDAGSATTAIAEHLAHARESMLSRRPS